MKVHVDQDRCQGHGRCYALAPDLFEPDEIGNGVETRGGDVPADQEDAARRAIQNCPEHAITADTSMSATSATSATAGTSASAGVGPPGTADQNGVR